MSLRHALAVLAGARPEILTKAPGDLTKQAVMGGVLLSTASLAGVAAFFALSSTLELAWWIAVPSALVWFVIVLNLDRLLVVTLNTVSGWKVVWVAVPRVLMAAVIGTVVATPLVLRIFQPEINAELENMRFEAAAQVQVKVKDAYRQVDELEKQDKELRDIIDGRNPISVSSDADVKALQAAYDKAQDTYLKADGDAQCELDGKCGTGVPGVGESYNSKKAAADRALRARDDAKRKLDDKIAEVTKRVQDGSSSAAEDAKKKIGPVQSDLAIAQERKRKAEQQALDAQQLNKGLLARLEALDRLTDGHASATAAKWSLSLLFFLIEVLPVITKLLTMFGSRTLYDRVLERHDGDDNHLDEVRSAAKRQQDEVEADAVLQLAKQKSDAQVRTAQAAVDELVVQQSRIAMNAIHVWAEVAKLRSDEQLDEWYREHVGSHVPSRRGPSPAMSTTLPAFSPVEPAEITAEMPKVNGSNPASQHHQP
ncbi:protein of unknown function [Lentzea waywayandensis]|uniref:DUF4407 domain-containing protein n=1 Tax=Lentzea waywayandensis TaxID=84724 RepID=A0A1I6EZ08_9PSEU|nr:DUF4407 domain-containing protein [Lentzea waywayandensis]SFR22908.1 protein of unknown function [Lentzea waywayandensis]